jgi:hypothetical protein
MIRTIAIFFLLAVPAGLLAQNDFDAAVFQSPPAKYRGHAMWNFPLATLNEKDIVAGIDEMARLNYGGFFIEAGGRPQPGKGVAFLSGDYFRFYKIAIEEAKKQGLEMILYDDYAFPTGTVGGQMLANHPDMVAKSLNMVEKDVAGPASADLAIPQGTYLGAVMMNRDTFDLVDVSARKTGDHVGFQAPKGNWKLMVFYLVTGKARVVDYLDDSARPRLIKHKLAFRDALERSLDRLAGYRRNPKFSTWGNHLHPIYGRAPEPQQKARETDIKERRENVRSLALFSSYARNC